MDGDGTWVLLVGFWFLCGLVAGYIYRQKGRSELAGCLGGLFLGPIGIILALVSSPDEEGVARREAEKEHKQLQRGEMKQCPYCAELIRPAAKVCRYCGREL